MKNMTCMTNIKYMKCMKMMLIKLHKLNLNYYLTVTGKYSYLLACNQTIFPEKGFNQP